MKTSQIENIETTKKILPLILATAIFMQMLDSTILNTSLPSIAKDLNESPLNMQNAIISYVLTLALFMPVSGFLADKFGTKKVFIISLILFSLGSLLCSLSPNLTFLVIARVIQGIGGSLMTPVGKLALIKTFDKSELLKAMNFAIIPALIGPVLGPLIGGYMVDYLSWHWIFLINLPIGILGIVLSVKYMPNYFSKIIDFDFKGFLFFAAASLLLSISLEWMGNAKNITPVLLVFLMGFIFIYLYYKHAKKEENPIFPLELFMVRTFRVGFFRKSSDEIRNQLNSVINSFDDSNCLRTISSSFWLDCSTDGDYRHVWKICCHKNPESFWLPKNIDVQYFSHRNSHLFNGNPRN